MVELMIEGVRGLRDGSLFQFLSCYHEGRQYFVMHPRVKIAAKERLVKQITK